MSQLDLPCHGQDLNRAFVEYKINASLLI